MKKSITLFFLLCTLLVYSQDKLSFGINAGLTYFDIRGTNFFEDYEPEINYLIGATIEYKIGKRLHLSTNINYERKGVKEYYLKYYNSETSGDGTITIILVANSKPEKLKTQFQFEYITIPIVLKYYFTDDNSFFINAGGFISHLLNVKLIDNGEESDLDFNDSFNKNDFGITFGIGYRYRINQKNSLSLELRDNFGMVKINKHASYYFSDAKTNSVNLILNWNFNL